MKTVITELIELRNKSFDAMKFVEWFDKNKKGLLLQEKLQIKNAFREGDVMSEHYFDPNLLSSESENYYLQTFAGDNKAK